MEEILISKKDLLNETGISYGQLYRWKRMDLIPEEWFIKKSSFTGQETYFPKDKILERINKILELKDEKPLEELADMFSNRIKVDDINEDTIIRCGIASKEAIDVFSSVHVNLSKGGYKLKEIMEIAIIEKLLLKDVITINELELIRGIMDSIHDNIENNNGTIYIIRKMGIPFCIEVFSDKVVLDEKCKVICKIDIKKYIEDIKFKMN